MPPNVFRISQIFKKTLLKICKWLPAAFQKSHVHIREMDQPIGREDCTLRSSKESGEFQSAGVKGTVARDSLPLFFFMNQPHIGP